MDRAVAARRDQVTLTALKRGPGDLRGMTGVSGPYDAVVKPLVAQDALDLAEILPYLPSPGLWVGDDDDRAERAGHGRLWQMVTTAGPPGS